MKFKNRDFLGLGVLVGAAALVYKLSSGFKCNTAPQIQTQTRTTRTRGENKNIINSMVGGSPGGAPSNPTQATYELTALPGAINTEPGECPLRCNAEDENKNSQGL